MASILRKEQEMWQSTGKSMQEAFQDLNALLVIVFLLESLLLVDGV